MHDGKINTLLKKKMGFGLLIPGRGRATLSLLTKISWLKINKWLSLLGVSIIILLYDLCVSLVEVHISL